MTSTIIYVHIPKTAGTTFNTILDTNFDRGRVFDGYKTPLEQLSSLSSMERGQLQVIKGHFPYGIHQYLSQTFQYITILRDPIERTISHYYFVLQNRAHPRHERTLSEKVSLEEYVLRRRVKELDNGQVRLISGGGFGLPFGSCDRELLDKAKHNLQHGFAAFGLTERFEETVQLICRRFGWKQTGYASRNVTKKRPKRDQLTTDALDALMAVNVLDLELYTFAKTLFEDVLRKQNRLVD